MAALFDPEPIEGFPTSSSKGMNGKIGILGGSKEYTGAPYYAASSALRSGSDIAHIFTPYKEAVEPIKNYSPEVIVHHTETADDMRKWLEGMHALVIGPGLGRDKSVKKFLDSLLSNINANHPDMKVILDADALFWLADSPVIQSLVNHMAHRVILTPNNKELERLMVAFGTEDVFSTAAVIGNPIIVHKGEVDKIYNQGKLLF